MRSNLINQGEGRAIRSRPLDDDNTAVEGHLE